MDASDLIPIPLGSEPAAVDLTPIPPTRQSSRPAGESSALGNVWSGLVNFGSGFARGVEGEGAPKGRGSEYPGGRPGFAGQAAGAGAHSVLEGLWDAIAAPGRVAMGDQAVNPADRAGMVRQALPTALMMAGQGWRPPIAPMRPLGQALREDIAEGARRAPGVAREALADTRGSVPISGALGLPGGGSVDPLPVARGGQAGPQVTPQVVRQQPPSIPIPGAAGHSGIPGEPRPGVPAPPGAAIGPSPYGGVTRQQPPAVPIPGAAGRSGIPGEPRPATPSPGGVTLPLPTSPLSDAIINGDASAVDKALVSGYRRAIKPGRDSTTPTIAGLDRQDARITTAFDQMIRNRSHLTLTDEAGNEFTGRLPQSRRQFAEGLDQLKRETFRQYSAMAGDAGVRVDLTPIIADLRRLAEDPVRKLNHPETASRATELADRYAERGSLSPLEAQDAVQMLNKDLKWGKNIDSDWHTIQTELWSALRNQLDKAIETPNNGPGYLQLRERYGVYRSIEKQLAASIQKHANNIPGGLIGQGADLLTTERALHGIFAADPHSLATAVGVRAARNLWKWANDPDRAIKRLFQNRLDPGRRVRGLIGPNPIERAGMGSMADLRAQDDNSRIVLSRRVVSSPYYQPSR